MTSLVTGTMVAAGNIAPEKLTITTRLIVNEAKLRNIEADVLVASPGLFRLTLGTKSILCQSSLTEKTKATSAEICLNKHLTNSILSQAGIKVPDQIISADHKTNKTFFQKHSHVVVKPPSLSRGHGITVDIQSVKEMDKAINHLREGASEIALIEQYIEGEDLRIVIIDYKFIAAVHRTPPQITGDGTKTVFELIQAVNKKKDIKHRTPLDFETKRITLKAGYKMKDVLPEGKTIAIRKNTNEATGGVPTDVTDQISPNLRAIAEKVSRIIDIPVTGIDFMVPSITGDDYVAIEVNRCPGLDGHEPQPVVEKFVDFLFPETMVKN